VLLSVGQLASLVLLAVCAVVAVRRRASAPPRAV
jgi:hypothetical protein